LSSNNVQNFTPSKATLPNLEDNSVAKNMGARERELKIKIWRGGGAGLTLAMHG
jgi:hypothetical protein